MKAKIKSLNEYTKNAKTNNCHWLLKNILSVTLQFDQKRNGYLAIMDAHMNLLNCKQGPDQTAEEFIENIVLWADTIEYHGGSIVENYLLASPTWPNGTLRSVDERKAAARE